LRSLFFGRAADEELDEELRYHFDREIARYMAEGMSETEARYAARRTMGGMEQRKEECRDSRGLRWLEDLLQDVKYSVRTLAKTPGFTLVAVLVLALAIGANTAVFTVVNGILLRPLPFQEADRLFLISQVPNGLWFDPGPIMVDRDYREFRRYNQSFESLAALSSAAGRKMTLTRQGEPTVLTASEVGPDFLRVLRGQPALGRAFLGDGQQDSDVVLLSHRLWMSRFGGDSKAVGKAILLDGASYTIAGVMPATFTFENADLWVRDEFRADPHNVYFIPVLGRLKPGVSPQQAQAELATFAGHMPADRDFSGKGSVTRIVPLKDLFVAGERKLLLIFAGAVGFVFLIACANFANLLLMRGAGRQPEIAVRAALGANRWRLVRQLMTESSLLSVAGATLGLLFSIPGIRALVALLPPEEIPPGVELRADMRVILFAFGLALVTGLAFGLAPALQATRRQLREGVSEGGRSVLARRERLRSGLVTVEIALALMLLTGAGLLVKSFLQMRGVNPGFRTMNLMVATVDLPKARYQTAAQMRAVDQSVLAALASVPGVKSAAAVSFLPFGHGVMGDFQIEDGRHLPEDYRVDKPEISSGYFGTMGIRILKGRGFSERDDSVSPGVVVISESVARRLWPAGDAVGKRISMEDHPNAGDWLTIVGIASDVRQEGLSDRTGAVVYQPYRQIKMPGFIERMSFIVQSESQATAAAGIRSAIRGIDKDLPTESITSMGSIVDDALRGTRSQARLLTTFSLVALLLAAIGLYGVLACSVAERTHEIGIRMAVGAGRNDIVWMIVGQTLGLTGSGVFMGILGALALTRVLAKLLFEVTPSDPVTFFAVTGMLITVALLAAFVPARRAAGVYPLEALRHD